MPKELIQLDLLELAATQDTKPSPPHPQSFVHHCHAVGCDKHVLPKMLMCSKHWRMVPKALQRAVWANYVAGQEITKTPSPEYLKAAHAAISAVQKAESLPAPTATRFAPGDVVLVRRLQSASAPQIEPDWFAAGPVVGYNPVGYVLVNVGCGDPYACPEDRLIRYEGDVFLWRLGQVLSCDRAHCQPQRAVRIFTCSQCAAPSQPHWWRTDIAVAPREPRWPDAVWFPAAYDPNERGFK